MSSELTGKRILVTRPQQQGVNLVQLLTQFGAQPVSFPTLEIVPLEDTEVIKSCLQNLKSYQWLIFISSNAVNFAVKANNGKIAGFKQAKIAAVGKATAQALTDIGLKADLVPNSGFNSEALLAMFALQHLQNQRILIVRGVGGRETLACELQKYGATVDYLEVYQRIIPVCAEKTAVLLALIEQQQLDAITITSSEALQNLLTLLGEPIKVRLVQIPLIVVSDRIKQIAATMGFKQIVVTATPADAAILDTVIMVCNGEDSGRRSN